jgi:two-component system nitrogen regulation sensor histidine kinase NtrY
VNVEAAMTATRPERGTWLRRVTILLRRSRIIPMLELASLIGLIVMAAISYGIITDDRGPQLLTPAAVAMLLVANLVPAMALMVFAARRIAMRRAAASPIGGRGRLHVRLVALFSIVASVPTLLVVIFASFLFQSGTDFWFSDRARRMLENAAAIARDAYRQEVERVGKETQTMATDLAGYLGDWPIDSPQFAESFARQVYYRNLSEAVILNAAPNGAIQSLVLVNPYDRPLDRVVTPDVLAKLKRPTDSVPLQSNDRIGAVSRLPIGDSTFIYAARVFDPQMTSQLNRAEAVVAAYEALLDRSRTLQFRFNAALFLVSLLIVALAIWTALALADRLVRPVGELVDAARRVAAGDLSARVATSRVNDEVSTLGNAFNRMTRRLEEQTGALLTANEQLESRRAFIEAVLSGVTAGVVSVDRERHVRLINSSAEGLLKTSQAEAVGKKLGDLAPELDRQLDSEEREDIIQFASGGEPRTLAVKRVKVETGHVLTFDDITQQLVDERRAAWSDVARRIAHEIKNPLTPIQLAAERLQRRYGKEIDSDPSTFERLTSTIVRQVGDLRRMVDEFSSFARMPKPVFRDEAIAEIAREVLFLQEVAHTDIKFRLDAPDPSPRLVCDKRQLGQALTNLVKNGVEAIHQRQEAGRGGPQEIKISVEQGGTNICIDVLDSGVGLQGDRGRLTEPYVTTRAKGTGLGLAIVKKIVEEHFGSMEFEDLPGGGTKVHLAFDAEALARLERSDEIASQEKVTSG